MPEKERKKKVTITTPPRNYSERTPLSPNAIEYDLPGLPPLSPVRARAESAPSYVTNLKNEENLDQSIIDLDYNENINKYASIREDSLGSNNDGHSHGKKPKIYSHIYIEDESEVWKAHKVSRHHVHRGQFWNLIRHETMVRYIRIGFIGIMQAAVAYFTSISSSVLIDNKYNTANNILQNAGNDNWYFVYIRAFFSFYLRQTALACIAAGFVVIAPVAAGSGIPEVKCFLNGIDLPFVTDLKTGICKVLGVVCSVSAGLPVGKEGPMIHSGAVVANSVAGHHVRDDKGKRDYISCGAAAGVCTAFSAPIGGILFALEEGASYWEPSLTGETFFCSMSALSMLLVLDTIGSQFGKVGFNRMFSFGNFIFIGEKSNFAVFELLLFAAIGIMGGLIGACFNGANERLTHWRLKHVNHSKYRRFLEVMIVSSVMSFLSFTIPLFWTECTPIPDESLLPESSYKEFLIPFTCKKGEEYNQVASLLFNEASAAIRLLFHMHFSAFDSRALLLFFLPYICMASIVYGMAVPSGLFVPSLLSGAAFGRLFGKLVLKIHPSGRYASGNTYSLIGAASVLGGMARMTISLTVILLECTGNEQYVLPLMISLMCARVAGGLFNEGLYDIHIHLKKGVNFLENDIRSFTSHHKLVAGQIMGKRVVFLRPVEKVGIVYDLLKSYPHPYYPVIDTDDGDILYGTINYNAVCILMRKRAFGRALKPNGTHLDTSHLSSNYIDVEPNSRRYIPLVQWEETQKAFPRNQNIDDIRINVFDRESFIDLRPYVHKTPYTVQETSSFETTYKLFRTLGATFLVVVNKYNQCVGAITRQDLTPESLSKKLLDKGKNE